jgi:hypothetical protein
MIRHETVGSDCKLFFRRHSLKLGQNKLNDRTVREEVLSLETAKSQRISVQACVVEGFQMTRAMSDH